MLKIYFSSTFYINIQFHSVIYPFNFDLKWYSYDKKKFITDDIILYIVEENIPFDYLLCFKPENAPFKADIGVDCNLPEEIVLKNFLVEETQIPNENFFNVELSIIKKPSGYYKNFFITIIMNKIKANLYLS